MNRARWGRLLVVIGSVLVLVSAFADPIGIGEGGGVGWRQLTGTIVGVVVVVVGLVLGRAERREAPSAEAGN